PHPLTMLDFMQCRGRWIHLDHRVRDNTSQPGEIPVLAMAINRGLCRGQHQWEFRTRIKVRCAKFRQWRLADRLQCSRPKGVPKPCSWYLRYRVSRGTRIVLRGALRSIEGVMPLGAR